MIPVCTPTLSGNEERYVLKCIRDNWVSSMGKYITEFENQFAAYVGARHGVSCSNGTAAVHLALAALGIREGDEVIAPNFTMIGTTNPVVYCNAKPVFVDSEPTTWNMDVSKLEEKITKNTKAIIPVHIYGHPVDMDPLMETAAKYHLKVIEDAAEAHGAEYKGRRAGSIGDMGCFSFYANKIITTGEGGMVVTNDDNLAEKLRSLRNHAFGIPRFVHKEVGFNYRMTNIQAAIGLAQLEQIDKFIESRRSNAKTYNELLKDIEGITLPKELPWAKNVYWMYGILLEDNFGMSKDQAMEELKKLGVETRSFFMPLHRQPAYASLGIGGGDYPVSDELFRKGLYLPSSSSLTDEQIQEVVAGVKKIRR